MKHYRFFAAAVAGGAGVRRPFADRTSAVASAPARRRSPFDSLHWRPIGPASMSGRIADIAVYEPNTNIWYVGTAHGGVWKTTNNGTTFEAAVPGPGADVDRRHRRVAEQSRSRLRRHRRVEQPPEHVVGRRHLQVDRRRQDLHEHRPQDLEPHQPHRHRPARQRRRAGSRRPGRSSAPAASAASSRRPTAARPGSRR